MFHVYRYYFEVKENSNKLKAFIDDINAFMSAWDENFFFLEIFYSKSFV